MEGLEVESDMIINMLFEACSIGSEPEGWWGHAPVVHSSTVVQVMEAWSKRGQQGGRKAGILGTYYPSRRDRLYQPVLLSWFPHCLPLLRLPS